MKKLILFCFICSLLICSCQKQETETTTIPITQLSLSPNSIQLAEGDSLMLKLSYTPTNAPSPTCTWTSSAPTVAVVNNNGEIKALSRGTTTITVVSSSNNALTAKCTINVTYKGDGTVTNPYLIYNVADLKAMRDSVNLKNTIYGNKVYKLMADLDFSNENSWTPIGTAQTTPFSGTFEGNGKVIKNIQITTTTNANSMQYAGLFGYISKGSVMNLGLQWTVISNSSSIAKCYLGGIAGYINDGVFENCYSTGSIMGFYAGGITGGCSGNSSITNCFSTATITGNGYTGGIIGYGLSATITNCYSSGNIQGGQYTGGIIGYEDYDSGSILIKNSYSSGNISSTDASCLGVGGIVGINGKKGAIINCYSTGTISSSNSSQPSNSTGGIAGLNNGNIFNCNSTGSISSCSNVINNVSAFAGGIAGAGTSSVIVNCYSTGSISSNNNITDHNSYAGGIVGGLFSEGFILNSYSTSTVAASVFIDNTSSVYSGGIAGYFEKGSLCNCIAVNFSISATNYYKINPARIANFYTGVTANNNFASTSIIVKNNYGIATYIANTSKDGSNLTGNPVDLLNAYVTANPTYSGITLSKWKVTSGVNNGYPVFQ